ncbi:MAG: hypothetical protein JWR19_1534 [Pedosphaera sp.]|jgi:hypothetical protein|nr:hypothetical protein [Pedosphaera sp.]
MKTMFVLFAAVLLLVAGCSTPTSVSSLRGHGTRQVFNAGYDRTWSAAVAAAQTGDLTILNADKATGYISTRRNLRPETFGENVAIWVRPLDPVHTEVEVVSRQAGPPILVMRNWEQRILASIAANLTT